MLRMREFHAALEFVILFSLCSFVSFVDELLD